MKDFDFMLSKAFVVLGHEIKFPSHELSEFSRARCCLLHNLISPIAPEDYIVLFMGKGRLQKNCPLSISQCMYNYFSNEYYSIKNLYIDLSSLDTVGDAVYSHSLLMKYPNMTEVIVVTSDWHLPRVSAIFRKVHASSKYFLNFSVSDDSCLMSPEDLVEQKLSESKSLQKFMDNFSGSIIEQDWIKLLKKSHWLYMN